jgi:hypothetical protein
VPTTNTVVDNLPIALRALLVALGVVVGPKGPFEGVGIMELGTLEKIIANPGTTYGDWRQWSDGVKGFTGPLRREQFGRFPRAFTYLTKLSATQFAEFITGEAANEKALRVATTAAIAGFIHEWRLSYYKIYGFDPDANDAEQSVFYFGDVPVLEYLQQARAMGVMEDVDADDDNEDAADDAKTGKKMRYTDAEFALIRRIQFEGDISSNKMPLVLALCRYLFTQEEPDENFYISSRSIVRHLKRLHDKDLRLQQEELEAWVASVPVCRSDTMTDCTYLDQEVMVSFDTWAPPGEYLHRTPKAVFTGVGPVAGKTHFFCAEESFYRTLLLLGVLFLGVYGGGCVDHAALGEPQVPILFHVIPRLSLHPRGFLSTFIYHPPSCLPTIPFPTFVFTNFVPSLHFHQGANELCSRFRRTGK